jgi:xylulokinase
MLTGVACCAYRDLAEAAQVFVGVRETYEPRADFHGRYAEIFGRYRKLYDAIRPLMEGET